MIDLRTAFRSELDEIEEAAVPIPAPRLAERVERTLSSRRRARTIRRTLGAAVGLTLVIVVAFGARRIGAGGAAREIAREPAPPSAQPSMPAARVVAPLPTEATQVVIDPSKESSHRVPPDQDRTASTSPNNHEKPSVAPSPDDMLERALTARGRGELETATGLLESLRAAHPGSSQAAIAAAYLGRDAARSGQRDAARRWFETYLAEQPSGPLEREASGQLIELTTGSEQTERARRYLAQHPNGPHAPLAKRVLAGVP